MTSIDNTGAQLITTLESTKIACEQFSQLYFSPLQTGILQRDTRLSELESALATVTNERDTLASESSATITALQYTLTEREATIAGLQQQLADLNAAKQG